MSAQGKIFKISRYSIHDGPGIRTTVFFKGCPGRCLWCCNPESQNFEREICWNETLCVSCGRCSSVCSSMAVRYFGEKMSGVDRDICSLCGRCADICPRGAIEICGRSVTADELFKETSKDSPFWRRSGGGVTLSGGEVLSQPSFVKEFLKICREKFVHSAIETCLFADHETLKSIAELADHIIFDLKAVDPRLHMKLTALDNKNILENAVFLLRSDASVLVRLPLIPGLNDGESDLAALGEFLEFHRPGVSIEILPYHGMGAGRYAALGREYSLVDTKPPSRAEMDRASKIIGRYSVKVI